MARAIWFCPMNDFKAYTEDAKLKHLKKSGHFEAEKSIHSKDIGIPKPQYQKEEISTIIIEETLNITPKRRS